MLTPKQKRNVRVAIAGFCEEAEQNRLRWYYAQIRPYTGLGVAPNLQHTDDCSAYVACAFWWAMHKTGIHLADPLNEGWTRYGYTGTQYAFLRKHPAPAGKYLVGDMAIFGSASNTVHTSICRKAGTDASAVFSSNGHQSWIFNADAPEPISLTHEKAREALVGVYRHPQLL